MLLRVAALVVLANALVTAQAAGPGAQAGSVIVTQLLRPDGTQQVWEITRERLLALPQWDRQGKLPLSHSAAIKLAETYATSQNPKVKGWQVVTTELRPVGGGRGSATGSPSSWWYRIQLAPEAGVPEALFPGIAGDAQRVTVVVMLDGSIVTPTVASASPVVTPRTAPGTSDVYLPLPGSGVVAPRAQNSPRPSYSDEAKRRRIQGRVLLQCVVDTDGRCQNITITRSLDSQYGLDEQAIKAAREYRFTPGTFNGKPAKVQIMLEFEFNLR